MSDDWFARPVLAVSDIGRSLAFYTGKLGFAEAWRFEEGGALQIVQVERAGCQLILSGQPHWRENAGKGVMFISLDQPVLDAVRAEFEATGVDVKDGQWGYRLMVVRDPDGNELMFPYPADPI